MLEFLEMIAAGNPLELFNIETDEPSSQTYGTIP